MRAVNFLQYTEIKKKLISGWNTWNNRSVLSYVHLPQGFAINLAWHQHYWIDEKYLAETLIGKKGNDEPIVRVGDHPFDAKYTSLELTWKELRCKIQTAKTDDDLVILINPTANFFPPVKLIIESGMLWNTPGALSKTSDTSLKAECPDKSFEIFCTKESIFFPTTQTKTPYLTIEFDEVIGISTGRNRSIDEIKEIIESQKTTSEKEAANYGELAEVYKAVQAGIAWNTIFDPKDERVISTVGRLWNEEYGGYCLFGWDNFFLSYMISLFDKNLAFANIFEHLKGATVEGFICNDNRGNGCKSFDRSQPPVGSIMVWEIFQRHTETSFLEITFEPLLKWNRWWTKKRMNNGLLSYGSHKAKNPFKEPNTNTMITAKYESGMDDSPMYEDVPFNKEKNVMELQDVGLNSLYIADCKALIKIGKLLNRKAEVKELEERTEYFSNEIEKLWSEDTGLYLNKCTDTGEFSQRISPTMFYPLLAEVVSQERAERMINEHFEKPEEFAIKYLLPSIAANDKTYSKQAYRKGAIWPPLNFLVYLGLTKYDLPKARKKLAESSLELFMNEWKRKGSVCENYSSETGKGDDPKLYSDNFHSWGALLGFIAFIEEGWMEKI